MILTMWMTEVELGLPVGSYCHKRDMYTKTTCTDTIPTIDKTPRDLK